MPSIIIFYLKKNPKLKEFMKETDRLMEMKSFIRLSADPLTYLREGTNVPLPLITSVITQVKASLNYNQSVSKIYVGNNLRTM